MPVNIIAENHICITEALYREASDAINNKKYRKSVLRIILILAVLMLAAAVYIIASGGRLILLLGELLFLGALCVWMLVILPRTHRRSAYKAMCRKTGGSLNRTVRFFENDFSVIPESGSARTFRYKDILCWTETKHLWIIQCRDKSGIILKKDGFVTGNIEAVRSLLVTE